MAEIAIVGAGLMGTAISYPLADNGHSVRLVGTHLDREIIQSCKEQRVHPRLKRELPGRVWPYYLEEIGAALEGVETIVSGVNSLGVHWIGKTLAPLIRPGQTILAITKGLEVDEDGNLSILPDVLRGELPAGVREQVRFAAVGGPCIAGELAGHRQTCVVFGSRHAGTVERLAELFRTGYYHVWTTTDLVGLEFSAALKNAYALAVGLAAGLLERSGGVDASGACMHNLAAAIFAQSTTEIARMLDVVGGTPTFAAGLPGAGDLYVTSAGGRTMRLGRLLGAGHTYPESRQIMAGETLEAAEIIAAMGAALPELEASGRLCQSDLPLMRRLVAILTGGDPADLLLNDFFEGQRRL